MFLIQNELVSMHVQLVSMVALEPQSSDSVRAPYSLRLPRYPGLGGDDRGEDSNLVVLWECLIDGQVQMMSGLGRSEILAEVVANWEMVPEEGSPDHLLHS